MENRVFRRCITIPTLVVVTVVLTALSPLLLLIALGIDLVRDPKRLANVRLLLLIVGSLFVEIAGVTASFWTWIITGFGLLGTPEWRWHKHRAYMGHYTNSLLSVIGFTIGAPIEWHDHANISDGNVIVIARHTSFFDALLPATLLAKRNQLLPHHVLTQGLTFAPCIDLCGHRFPNVFVQRTPGQGSSDLSAIEELGTNIGSRSAALIFPEGTFRTAQRFERAVQRLGRNEPERAARAAALAHVLPPRAAGTHALLAGAPTADVVICTNTGFEPFGSLRSIASLRGAEHRILIETWTIERATIPEEYDDFTDWLLGQYEIIDAWVQAQRVDDDQDNRL